MKTGVILHGQKKGTARIIAELRLRFPDTSGFEYRLTRQPRETVSIAREWSADKELIVVCGGDGTLHEAVNGMMEFRNKFPGKPLPVLGLLPLGTGNDYARQYGWKCGDIPQLCDRIKAMHTRQADVGRNRPA
jgi:diacylglycerol kinase family enzyme